MLSISFYEDSGHACILDTVLLGSSHGLHETAFDEDLKNRRKLSSLPICMHGIVSYRRECNNLESFAAGSLYSTPALQQMSRVYQCCCGQRAEKPAAVIGPPLRARQAWSMRGPWNIHATMRYATSRLSSYVPSYSYPVPFTLSRWRCSCIPKVSKRQSGAMRVEGNRVHIPQMWLIRLHRPIRLVCQLPGQSN